MTESPDAMLRRVLSELYPLPQAPALPLLTAALALGTAGHDLRPDECEEIGWGLGEGC